jgi:hypothetical protein
VHVATAASQNGVIKIQEMCHTCNDLFSCSMIKDESKKKS